MVSTIIACFALVAFFLAGFIVAQLAQRIVVPLLVQLLGEHRFASPSAFDGCTLGIAGGVVMILLSAFMKKQVSSLGWSLVIIFLGISTYGLVWLWCLGFRARKRGWSIKDNQIVSRNGEALHPTFVRERSDYFQTDAFNGYSHYFLDLYDDQAQIATNAYNSEDEKNRDREAVDKLLQVRRLDLAMVWPAEALKWAVYYFGETWTPLLCGPLEKLTPSQRKWWRQWLIPNIDQKSEIVINPAEWHEHLQVLREQYADYWSQFEKHELASKPGEPFKTSVRPQTWDDNIPKLEWILNNSTSEISVMTNETYEEKVMTSMDVPVMLMHGHENEPFVTIEPA